MAGTQTGTATLGQSRFGTKASSSDAVLSRTQVTSFLGWCYPFARVYSQRILSPADWGVRIISERFGLGSLFNGISTFLTDLMPKPYF